MKRARVLLAVAALTGGLMVGSPVLAETAIAFEETSSAPAVENDDAAEAAAKAVESGQRVEVESLADEYTETYANPDGQTFSLDMHAAPQRVQAADGSWMPIDPRLEWRDGRVAPKASPLRVSFSGGGDESPAVSLEREGASLDLAWPTALPVPTLEGDSAIYRDVMPDVDLVLTATDEGYRQVLRVNTPEAGALPGLDHLRLGLQKSNLTLVPDQEGGLVGFNGAGHRVLASPAPEMWDSAASDPGPSAPGEQQTVSPDAVAPGELTAGAPAAEEQFAEPSTGDAVAEMGLGLSGSRMTITPDQDFLADPDTVYPVYIDPTLALSRRTMVGSNGEHEYNFTGDEGVGRCAGSCLTNGGAAYTKRMFFQFNNGRLAGKYVTKATFRLWETWSYSCTASNVRIVRVDANISTGTRWPGPTGVDPLAERATSHGRGTSCSPSQPDSWVEFADNGDPSDDLTATVRNFGNGSYGSEMTIMVRASDETAANGWKRFRGSDATLSADFVWKPAAPTAAGVMTTTDPASRRCSTNAAAPSIVANPKPTLTATVQAAGNGDGSEALRAEYNVQWQSGSTWVDQWAGSRQPSSGSKKDGDAATLTPASNLADHLWRFRVRTLSYGTGSDPLMSAYSPAGAWCYFLIDSTGALPPSITSSDLPPCTANSCPPALAPGSKGHLSFSTTELNVEAFRWQLDAGPVYAITGSVSGSKVVGAAEVRLPTSGEHTVTGWAVESITHKVSPKYTLYRFKVGLSPNDVGTWSIAADPGPNPRTVANSAPVAGAPAMTLGAGATVDGRGRRESLDQGTTAPESSIRFTGDASSIATTPAVLDTLSSFTVSAWVYPTDLSHNATVVAQARNDAKADGFALRWEGDHWAFTWHDEAEGTESYSAEGPAGGQPENVWTHVAGTYDADAHQITLYVNGEAQASTPVETTNGSGPFTLGATHFSPGQADTDRFVGLIDEVHAANALRTPEEIAQLAGAITSDGNQALALVGAWDPSLAASTSVPDVSPYGRALSLGGGAAATGETIHLDGVDDFMNVAGPLVDDNGSFTVALSASTPGGMAVGQRARIIGQQRTAAGSSWALAYQQTSASAGVWSFSRWNTDGTIESAAVDQLYPVDIGETVQLVGTYDAQSDSVHLYVLDEERGVETSDFQTRGTGDLVVAKPPTAGPWSSFKGDVGLVRIWAGAMDSNQIDAEVIGS